MTQATELIARQVSAGLNISKIWGSLIFNVLDTAYGATGLGFADDSVAINKTCQAAYKAGGGIVYAPRGIYLLKSQLIIPKGVILMGMGSKAAPQWVSGSGWDKTNYGTVFAIDWGAGGESINNAAFLMSSYTQILGCNFWYPNQSGSTLTPVQYPPTIAHVNGDPGEANNSVMHTDIKGCSFVNPWIAGDFTRSHELLNMSDIQFYSWHKGFIIDQSADVDRLQDIHGNPNIMYRGEWPGNNAYEYTLADSTSIGLEIGRADQLYMERCFVYGFYYSGLIQPIGPIGPNGIYMSMCGFEGSINPLTITGKVRRINLDKIMLGTVARSTANVSLNVSLDADSIIDEIVLLNVTSFTSAKESFYLNNLKQLTMIGCKAYGSNQFNAGFEQASIRIGNSSGFTIKDTHSDVYGTNPNAVNMRMTGCNGFIVEDLFISGQTNTAQEVYADATCSNGRFNRVFKTNSSGAGVASGSATVTIADTIIY